MSAPRNAACGAVLALAMFASVASAAPRGFVTGADVSSLADVERAGAVFSDSGRTADAMTLLAARGRNAVRLRVWVDGADSACGVARTTALARRAAALGLPVLVDLHYSDTWADPGRQDTPARWAGVRGSALDDSVRTWTREALRAIAGSGAVIAAVQTGNEVTNGLLWPEGRLTNGGSPAEWRRLARLLTAAARGVREGAPGARVLVHVDRGGDAAGVTRYFDRLDRAHVPYDDVALSWYPWWHGSLDALGATLRACDQVLHRDAWVVETAFPWTTGWFDDTRNVVGDGTKLASPHAPSPEGQRAFVAELLALARRSPRVRGVFWWEPADVPAPRRGSAWENCTLFDAQGALLPAGRQLRGK